MKRQIKDISNLKFIESYDLNQETFLDYLRRFKKIALSMFEWVNLPNSMNQRFLEETLFYYGKAAFLFDKNKGFINTKCTGNGELNIYKNHVSYTCYSVNYQTTRNLYTGLKDDKIKKENECILVKNNEDSLPTLPSLELFAQRLTRIDRACDVNISTMRFPLLILGEKKQLLSLKNLYSQYDGNIPVIFANKNKIDENTIKVLNTESKFICNELIQYKKEIMNEALSFLGVSSININKKERLTENESNIDNEVINLNLQAMLTPRIQACKEFNDKFNLTGTEKEISVRLRSDIENIIKKELSIVKDFEENKEGVKNE